MMNDLVDRLLTAARVQFQISGGSTDIAQFMEHEAAMEIERLTTEGANKDAVLLDIASQSKSDELGDDREDADFEGAYDIMIQLARSVSGGRESHRVCVSCGRTWTTGMTWCPECNFAKGGG